MKEFIIEDTEQIFDVLAELSKLEVNPDRPISIKIDEFKSKRSIAQNNLFWSWMRMISKETGNTMNALHDYFCEEFLGKDLETVHGKEQEVIRGTSKLNTAEMTDFLFQIESFAASELGIRLPHPEEDLRWQTA